MKDKRIMTLSEVGKRFNRDRSTIYEWIAHKNFPYIHMAGRRYYLRDKVDEWEKKEGWRISKKEFDFTTEEVETPIGTGKYMEYDGFRKLVKVEIGHMYCVWFEAKDVYIIKGKEKTAK